MVTLLLKNLNMRNQKTTISNFCQFYCIHFRYLEIRDTKLHYSPPPLCLPSPLMPRISPREDPPPLPVMKILQPMGTLLEPYWLNISVTGAIGRERETGGGKNLTFNRVRKEREKGIIVSIFRSWGQKGDGRGGEGIASYS